MFMLKTGGSYSLDEGARESYATNATDESETKPTSSEHYQLRRISIADTHLWTILSVNIPNTCTIDIGHFT